MTVTVEVHADAASFLAHARKPLEEREDENGYVLGLALRAERGGRPGDERMLLATLARDGELLGAVASPPGRELAHTDLADDAVEALVTELAGRGLSFCGSLGPRPAAERLAELWARRTGVEARVAMEKRLYRLDAVEQPPAIAGALRPARGYDIPLMREWIAGFMRDARLPHTHHFDLAELHLKFGTLFLWETTQPVAIAACTRPTRHSACIGSVYTPPDQRGHGYGSAVTAALSQHLLDTGKKFVVLFTDLANATSNRIYARIGYRPVRDFRLYAFEG